LARYLAIDVNYGFDLSATRDISSVRSNALEVKRISSAIWTAKLKLLILALGLLMALIVFVGKVGKEYAIMLILFGIVIGNALFPTWLFQGLECMGFISVTHLVTRAAG
jgi:PST family polysaccharide transporter